VLARLTKDERPVRPAAITGREPVLRDPQLVRVALFVAERVAERAWPSHQLTNDEILSAIRQALPPNVAQLPASVPAMVEKASVDGDPQASLVAAAARALVCARPNNCPPTLEALVRGAVQRAAYRVLHKPGSQRGAALSAFLRELDELLLSLEIAAAAYTDFAGRRPRVLFRAGARRLDVAVVSFSDGYGALARVGPRRKKRRRYLRWFEGPLDEVLSVIPERYFAAAVRASMPQKQSVAA
jgi:hypothetical protein